MVIPGQENLFTYAMMDAAVIPLQEALFNVTTSQIPGTMTRPILVQLRILVAELHGFFNPRGSIKEAIRWRPEPT